MLTVASVCTVRGSVLVRRKPLRLFDLALSARSPAERLESARVSTSLSNPLVITLHALARQVRAVFRHPLGTSPRGPFPAVSLRADQQG